MTAHLATKLFDPSEMRDALGRWARGGISPDVHAARRLTLEEARAIFHGFTHDGLTTHVNEVHYDSGGRVTVSGDIRDAEGAFSGAFTRTFDALTASVKHVGLGLAQAAQRRGFATAFNAHAERAYAANGYRHIEVNAQIDGAEVWAKAGWNWRKRLPPRPILDGLRRLAEGRAVRPSAAFTIVYDNPTENAEVAAAARHLLRNTPAEYGPVDFTPADVLDLPHGAGLRLLRYFGWTGEKAVAPASTGAGAGAGAGAKGLGTVLMTLTAVGAAYAAGRHARADADGAGAKALDARTPWRLELKRIVRTPEGARRFGLPIGSTIRPVARSRAPVNQRWAGEAAKAVERRYGATTRSRAREALAAHLERAHVWVRLPHSVLDDVLDEAGVRNQFETYESSGLLSPELRALAERELFGLPLDTPPRTRPVYGYLAESGFAHRDLRQYGDAALRLRPHVRERTTYSLGDTLDDSGVVVSTDELLATRLRTTGRTPADPDWDSLLAMGRAMRDAPQLAPQPLTSPPTDAALDKVAKALPLLDSLDELDVSYVEAQIHGGVSLADVAEVHLDARVAEWLYTDALAADLARHGVTLVVDGVEMKSVRRVRTPAGARTYGEPIGAVITRDVDPPSAAAAAADVVDERLTADRGASTDVRRRGGAGIADVNQYKLYRALLRVDDRYLGLKRGRTHELSKRLAANFHSLRAIGNELERAQADGLVDLRRHKWTLAYHLRDLMVADGGVPSTPRPPARTSGGGGGGRGRATPPTPSTPSTPSTPLPNRGVRAFAWLRQAPHHDLRLMALAMYPELHTRNFYVAKVLLSGQNDGDIARLRASYRGQGLTDDELDAELLKLAELWRAHYASRPRTLLGRMVPKTPITALPEVAKATADQRRAAPPPPYDPTSSAHVNELRRYIEELGETTDFSYAARVWNRDPARPFELDAAAVAQPNIVDIRASLRALEPKLRDRLVEAHERLTTAYPNAPHLLDVEVAKLGLGTNADYTAAHRRLRWSHLRKTFDVVRVSRLQQVDCGWHPPGTADVTGTYVHEFGHHLHRMLTPEQEQELASRIAQAIGSRPSRDLTSVYMSAGFGAWPRLVSEYACRNQAEMIAEAFAEYRLSKTPRAVARAVGGYFDEVYGS